MQGQEIPGAEGYLYYGAAKDLPGVREFLMRPAPVRPTKNLEILKSRVGEEYFCTDLDPELVEIEKNIEEANWSIDRKKRRVLDYEDNTLKATSVGNQKYLKEAKGEI
jgi:hypothetical protein